MWRRPTAYLALGWTLAATLYAGDARPAGAETSFEDINRSLKGHRATIEVNGYEPVSGARNVSMGSSYTTWRIGAQQQQVATSAVQRITIDRRSRSLKWMKWGALVGAGFGATSGGYSEKDGLFFESPDASNIASGAAAGAAIGSASGAIAGKKVVYEAEGGAPVNSDS